MVADAEIPIIHPPPEVKNIVDKTAGFVARNGVEFETRIKQVDILRKQTLLSLPQLHTVIMPCHKLQCNIFLSIYLAIYIAQHTRNRRVVYGYAKTLFEPKLIK